MSKKFLVPIGFHTSPSDPSTGTEGEIYFNSTNNELRIFYDGTWNAISAGGGAEAVYSADAPTSPTVGQLWIESDVDVNTYNAQIITRWSKTLTGTESSFSGLSSGILLQYTVGYEQVYLNGVLLLRGTDYTATDGLTVVLTSAAASGDVIEILCPNNFTSVNTYTQSQIDTALALKANIASPTLTGIPTAPTAAVDTNTTQLATTAFVIGQGYLKNSTASSTYLTQSSAISTYAPLANPTFTGTPLAPTASAGTNTTQIATTAYVRTEVSNLVASAPAALDTLNELATALGNDPNFATTVNTALSNRVLTTGGSTVTVSSGTTVPLTIQNNGTGNSFVVNDEASDSSPFTISASGNVGIGGSTTGAKLEVFEGRSTMVANSEKYALLLKYNAAASNGAYLGSPDTGGFTISTQGGGELFRVDTSGNVGINEVSPNSLLELTKSSSGGTVSGNPFIVLSNRNNTNSSFVVGGIVSDTYRDIADPHYSAGIWFTREPFSGNFSSSGSIVFGAQFNTSAGSLPIERMRIDYDGRVKLPAGGILEAPVSTNAQTGTAYTLVLTDAGRVIEMNNAAANTLTVPTDASVNFPVGTVIDIFQTGAGQTTVDGAGVTINARPGLKLSGQWATATLIKRAANTWLLTGSLSA